MWADPFHRWEQREGWSNDATALGLNKGFMYEPSSDFTPTQYLLAHAAGGSPVLGAAESSAGDPVPPVYRGEIVQVDVDGPRVAWNSTLDSLKPPCVAETPCRNRVPRAGQLQRQVGTL